MERKIMAVGRNPLNGPDAQPSLWTVATQRLIDNVIGAGDFTIWNGHGDFENYLWERGELANMSGRYDFETVNAVETRIILNRKIRSLLHEGAFDYDKFENVFDAVLGD